MIDFDPVLSDIGSHFHCWAAAEDVAEVGEAPAPAASPPTLTASSLGGVSTLRPGPRLSPGASEAEQVSPGS